MQRLFLAFSRIFASGSTLKPFSKSLAWLLLAAVSAGSLAATLDGFQDPLMLSGDPPGNNPLRI